MRDPARIARMLAKLGEVWQEHPDLRLGQLIVSMSGVHSFAAFFVEDDEWERRLDEVIATGSLVKETP